MIRSPQAILNDVENKRMLRFSFALILAKLAYSVRGQANKVVLIWHALFSFTQSTQENVGKCHLSAIHESH